MNRSADPGPRVVLIDGADTPLGAAAARFVVAHGARVALLGDDAEVLEATAGELGPSVISDQRVVSDPSQAYELLKAVVAKVSHIDSAFSARGSVIRHWDGSESPVAVQSVIERDLVPALLSVKALVEHFSSRAGGGRIVTTAVAAGSFGLEGAATFSSVSGAIAGMTKSHAIALRGTSVRINAVAPILNSASGGGIVDEMSVLDESRYCADVVAPVIGFLTSDRCTVSGQIISVGAGRAARTFAGTVAGFLDPQADLDGIEANLAQILSTDHPIMLDDSRDELLLIEV